VIVARGLAALATALCVLGLAGCGGDAGPSTVASTTTISPRAVHRLTASERRLIADSEMAIEVYCRRSTLGLVKPRKRPSADQRARALDSVDALVALAHEKPAGRVRRAVDVRLLLSDLAEDLEGSNCDPAIISRIDQGLAGIPPTG
jgi:hypothetical protein